MRRHHQVQIPSKQGSKRVLLIQSQTSALLHEVAALKTSPMNAHTQNWHPNAFTTDEENRAASEPNGDREKGDNREGKLLARER